MSPANYPPLNIGPITLPPVFHHIDLLPLYSKWLRGRKSDSISAPHAYALISMRSESAAAL